MSVLPSAEAYVQGSDLPDLGIEWYDSDGNVRDFSTGWTFVVKVGTPGSAALFSKSSGIVGSATIPNLTISWSTSGELNTIAAGLYSADIIATRTADNKQLIRRIMLPVKPPIS